ncbi:MAG: hypothetical protein QFF03_10450 [Pseudomonadota bacterium]|nr:hypothetical protein [Pseudomonadota bacterium]
MNSFLLNQQGAMGAMGVLASAALASASIAGMALAQQPQPAGAARPASAEAPMQVVHVDGLTDADAQSYRRMIKGMDAFEKFHALAPDARLRYRLYPRRPGVKAAGTTLAIQSDTVAIPVALASDLSFTLPRDARALADYAQVVSNRKTRSFAWGPDVRTPGLAPNTRRLGDLRLECEIDRAAALLVGYKPPLYYAIDAAVDVCTTYPGHWLYYGERAVFNVTMVHGQRRQVIFARLMYGNQIPKLLQVFYDFHPLLNDRTYTLNVADTSWPDDTVVELEYMDDDGAAGVPAHTALAAP